MDSAFVDTHNYLYNIFLNLLSGLASSLALGILLQAESLDWSGVRVLIAVENLVELPFFVLKPDLSSQAGFFHELPFQLSFALPSLHEPSSFPA